MTRPLFCPALILLFVLVLAPAASATLVLSEVTFTPDLQPGPKPAHSVVAHIAIIPSGSTTFSPGHELQMQTGFESAQWQVQVTRDGRNAAYLEKSGRVAFVNGELLSYATNHDVGMIVTIRGNIPPGTAGSLRVLQVDEIDNSGRIVPGSTLTISQPVAAETPVSLPSANPTLPPTRVPAETPPMKASGFGTLSEALASVLAVAFLVRPRA